MYCLCCLLWLFVFEALFVVCWWCLLFVRLLFGLLMTIVCLLFGCWVVCKLVHWVCVFCLFMTLYCCYFGLITLVVLVVVIYLWFVLNSVGCYIIHILLLVCFNCVVVWLLVILLLSVVWLFIWFELICQLLLGSLVVCELWCVAWLCCGFVYLVVLLNTFTLFVIDLLRFVWVWLLLCFIVYLSFIVCCC